MALQKEETMTTRKKFDPKTFRGKARIYLPVAGSQGVQRVYVWDSSAGEYRPPAAGKAYLARRWERTEFGTRVRATRYFATLDEARGWRQHLEPQGSAAPGAEAKVDEVDRGPTLAEVVDGWRRRRLPALAVGTRVSYENLLRLHFGKLMPVPVRGLTPALIDAWLAELVDGRDKFKKGKLRKSFSHELQLLTTILRDYHDYADDPQFVVPVRSRHRKAARLRNRLTAVKKDLTEAELQAFLSALEHGSKYGPVLSVLAVVQYYQALRISEAAALRWEDVRLDEASPRRSRLYVTQHVCFVRGGQREAFIEPGFKNSDACGGIKEHPMLPPVYAALRRLWNPGASGLVFQPPGRPGTFFTYRSIQFAYNQAFAKAGLPYTSTHVMRHGGTRKTYDETGGDLEVAKQHLGNRDLASVLVYAQRSATAFNRYADAQWDVHDGAKDEASDGKAGRKWSQPRSVLRVLKGNQ